MTMREFIRQNRAELDEAINRVLNFVPSGARCNCPKSGTTHSHNDAVRLNNEDRRQWILNDEGLYQWARRNGVRI